MKEQRVYAVFVCVPWHRLKGKEKQVKTMEALLEEKEKEIVKKGECLQVSCFNILKGNKFCCSLSGWEK